VCTNYDDFTKKRKWAKNTLLFVAALKSACNGNYDPAHKNRGRLLAGNGHP
jgi:hypothetical protein